ncbi:MAG: hypothetical protein IIW77_05600 [Bacteroidaceae bacterium]|nr:hypothetical protein [Bacteroidaceae bacterium]
MLPGNCILASCPHCGEKKELLQLLSGNTFGAVLWSDAKQVAPMLPCVSDVQKCPACGHYFFLSEAKTEEGDDYSFETGRLSFDESIEAFGELNGCSDDELENLSVVVAWAFNDIIREKRTPTPEQYAKFKDIISSTLEHPKFVGNELLKAELYREIGEFEKCLNILSEYTPEESFLAVIKEKIIEKAKERDCKVFVIEQ